MKDARHLDFLYDHWSERLGWLSWLEENFDLSIEEVHYLRRRADNDEGVRDKLMAWDEEIARAGGWAIYNEENVGRKLAMVNARIDEIEKQAETIASPESRLLFLGISPLDSLAGLRYRIRNQIISMEVPDRKEIITDAEIDRARLVPLSKVIPNLPKTHKILCPFHQEKSPSFHVQKWGFCFGCGKHIDSIGWVMGQEKKSFVDAVKYLCSFGH